MIIKSNIYDKFSCIASDCDFTCCQSWKIGVDEETYKKWNSLTVPDGKEPLSKYTSPFKDAYAITLNEDHLCPFLNQERLCSLVLKYGPCVLSTTCDTFPREKKEQSDHEEWTLMTSCPAVVDLLSSEEAFRINFETCSTYEEKLRLFAMNFLQNSSISLEKAWIVLHYLLLEFWQKGTDHAASPESQAELLLENLDSFLLEDDLSTLLECNDLFLDMTKNYEKDHYYEKYLTDFIEKSATISEYYSSDEETEEDPPIYETYCGDDFKEAFRCYSSLLKKWAAARVFESSLLMDDTLEDMIVNIEWIVIQYTMIRHMAYLKYHTDYKLDFKDIRDYIVLTGRISGYTEDDINEYMEASFDDSIWDWGYLVLLTGM